MKKPAYRLHGGCICLRRAVNIEIDAMCSVFPKTLGFPQKHKSHSLNSSNASACGPEVHPIKPSLTKDKGCQSIRFKYTEGHRPECVKTIAMELKDSAWQQIEWRAGWVAGIPPYVSGSRIETTPEGHDVMNNGYWLNGQRMRKSQPETG